ncbi:hypothetical protein [Rhodanobacter hydrolyticus]|uniref:DUF904 domain-containing protein n=1 Tax=Rhodanobacter hydrolyticus TaxID=2250595 RepID=A0ABW8J4Q2_9GAMM
MGTKEKDSSARELVRALSAENKRLHSQIARHEAKEITYKNRIAALEAEIKSGNNRELKKILNEISNAGSSLPVQK